MFPWQGEGKSSVMGVTKAPANESQQQKEAQGTGLRWRAPSFFQRNRSKETPNTSPGIQQKTTNMPEVVDVDVDDNDDNSPNDDTHMSDAPGDEQRSSESRASQTDGEEEGDDIDNAEDDEASEGGDIQDTASDNQPAVGTSTSADDGHNDNNNNSTNGPLAATSGPSFPVQPGSSQHVILEANRTYYGKRLNFREQVVLFEICNKYKSTFGERSKLCEWWRTVTEEFCRDINGPYSWHSVRRKVEQVTKQRIKQRSDEENPTDSYPDDLCKVVDEFIPVWSKFEASEKRRIEVRDSRAASAKKRKVPPTGVATPRTAPMPPGPAPWHASAQRWRPANSQYAASSSPIPQPQFYTPPGVKMPAGYDTMFHTPRNGPPTPQSGAAPGLPYPPHTLRPPPPPQPRPQTSVLPPPPHPNAPPQQRPLSGVENAASGGLAESSVTSAVLETLSKLNKHLEQAAAAAGGDKQAASSSPIVAALASAVSGVAKVPENSTSGETATEKSPAAVEQPAGEPTNTAHSPTTTNHVSIPSSSSSSSSPSSPSSKNININTSAPASTTSPLTVSDLSKLKNELKQEMQRDFLTELSKIRDSFSERLNSMEQTQAMIIDMLKQGPGRDKD
ncbi:uncharacterized protein TRUGW13939_11438 [Talaromyces rugulosus]|uniref:Uncharacterized protein n=1 Tax=Talaromyces rugulosus TaxID=121627 RepID=A0A7H8RFC6_TALRU|nr:uncharacterized protein TRUGW13939_11438 [Talaromyces rugulosus]QKX64265.1 hypothetical protein TRUGW13939_11438 [Talaromyces rugulosus]